jgi:hypothetical protein
VQHFGKIGFHAGSLAGGQDDNFKRH